MQIQFIMADPLKCDWVLIDSWWSQSSGGNLRSITLHNRLGCLSSGKTVKPAAASKTIQLENGEHVAVVWYSMMESHTIRDCSLGPIYFRITQRCRQPEICYELRFYVDFRLHHTWKCNWNMTLIKRFVKKKNYINSNYCVVTESNVCFLISELPPQFLYRLFSPWPPWSHKW